MHDAVVQCCASICGTPQEGVPELRWENLPPRRLAARATGVTVAATTVAASVTAATTTSTAAVAGAALGRTVVAATEAGALRRTVEAATAAAETTTTAAATSAAVLAEVTSSAATATAAARPSTAAATVRRLAGNGVKERRNLLIGLLENINKLPNDATVATVEEGGSQTSVSGTTSSTNTMNVVVNVSGEIVVDNVKNVGDIQTT